MAVAASTTQRNHVSLDADLLGDIEKKWQAKEKMLTDELTKMDGQLKERDESINSGCYIVIISSFTYRNYVGLTNQVADLTKRQFQPRMERLKLIERDVKSRMEEFVLAEERMETGLLCPRDLQIFKMPMTLVPCGVSIIISR